MDAEFATALELVPVAEVDDVQVLAVVFYEAVGQTVLVMRRVTCLDACELLLEVHVAIQEL